MVGNRCPTNQPTNKQISDSEGEKKRWREEEGEIRVVGVSLLLFVFFPVFCFAL